MSEVKHTPGPWTFEPSIPEEGVQCIWLKGAMTPEGYRPEIGCVNGPQDAKAFADARRITACVNACERVTTERLEDLGRPLMDHLFGADDRAVRMLAVQADLVAAVCALMAIHTEPSLFAGKYGEALTLALDAQQRKIDDAMSKARAAISKATGAPA